RGTEPTRETCRSGFRPDVPLSSCSLPCCRESRSSTTFSAAPSNEARCSTWRRATALSPGPSSPQVSGKRASSTACCSPSSSAACPTSPARSIQSCSQARRIFLKTPPHAAIDLAVTLAQYDPKAKRYDKLVNAVLRRVANEGEVIASALDAARVNTPDWLWSRWVSYWGEARAHAIAEANLIEPPLDLTVKNNPALWAERLSGRVLVTGSVRLLPKGRIESLASYDEGAWWVQDVAASLPAKLLGHVAGQPVADLCAAPGGKTAQLVLGGASVIAVDNSKTRLKLLAENLKRLHLEAELVEADAASWQPGGLFDAVLLDAPCSSTGIIRRHPDIPYVKSEKDIEALAGLQAHLLDNAARLVRPGGKLVYSTCSLEPEEGEAQIAAFLTRNAAFNIDPISPAELYGQAQWIEPSGCLRTFPYELKLDSAEWSGMDGFFAARLARGS